MSTEEETKLSPRLILIHKINSLRNLVGSFNSGAEGEEKRERKEKGGGGGGDSKEMKYDSTGLYHWCPDRQFQSALVTRQEAAETSWLDHLVVGVFAEASSPPLGLRNLIMPLRASNIPHSQIRQVVILGNIQFIEK